MCAASAAGKDHALRAVHSPEAWNISPDEHPIPQTQERGGKRLRRNPAAILQLNIGLYCNQACSHCHVESSPARHEMMDRPTAEQCVQLMANSLGTVRTVDITGGAPELNSQFRWGEPALALQI